jgi:hypothetical protein
MNSQIFKKEYIYPKIWNDDDIIKFKYYLKEALDMYDGKMPSNFIELCVERQINEEKGLVEPIDYSKIEQLEITTPYYDEIKTVCEDNNSISIEA